MKRILSFVFCILTLVTSTLGAYSNEKIETFFGLSSITTSSTLNGWTVVTLTNSSGNACPVVSYGARKTAEAAPGTALYVTSDTALQLKSSTLGTIDTTHGKMMAMTFNISPEVEADTGQSSVRFFCVDDVFGNPYGTAVGLSFYPNYDGSGGLHVKCLTYGDVSGSEGRVTTDFDFPNLQAMGTQMTLAVAVLRTGSTNIDGTPREICTYKLYHVQSDHSCKPLFSFDSAGGTPGKWVIETGNGSERRYSGRISGLVTADITSFADVAYTNNLVLPPTTGTRVYAGNASAGTADGSSPANQIAATTLFTDILPNHKLACFDRPFFDKNSAKPLPRDIGAVTFRNLVRSGRGDFRGNVISLTQDISYSGLMRLTKANCGIGIEGNGHTISGYQDITSSWTFDSNASTGKIYKIALPTCHFLWQDSLAAPFCVTSANTDASAKTALNAKSVMTWTYGNTNLYLLKADSVDPTNDGHAYYLSGQGFSLDVGGFYLQNIKLRGLGIGFANQTDAVDPLDQQGAITHTQYRLGYLMDVDVRFNPGKHQCQMAAKPTDPAGSTWFWDNVTVGEGNPTTAFGLNAGAGGNFVWFFDNSSGHSYGNRAAVINCSSSATNTMGVVGVSGGLPTQNNGVEDFDSHGIYDGSLTELNSVLGYDEFAFIGNNFTAARMRSGFCTNPIDFYGNNTSAATFDPNGLGLNVLTSNPLTAPTIRIVGN